MAEELLIGAARPPDAGAAATPRRCAGAATGLLLALLLVAGPPATASPDLLTPVARVEIRSDAPEARDAALSALLTVRVGEPFDREEAARTLRNLQASGVVGASEVWVGESPEGVVVIFAVWKKVRVVDVRIEGELGLGVGELERTVEQRKGEPLVESRVVRSVYRLKELYHARGYLEATVRVAVDVDHELREARILFEVSSGSPFTVAGVGFEGDLGALDRAELIERFRSRPGERYRARATEDDAERLEDWLIGQGWRRAVVETPRAEIDWQDRSVQLVYPIRFGRRYEIEVVGGDQRLLAKKGLLPVLGRERFDEAVLLETIALLRSHYQEMGHYLVGIERDETRTDEALRLRLRIEPGAIYQLVGVSFSGNRGVSDERLRTLMATSPRRRLGGRADRLVDRVLDADLANVRSFYLLEGYAEVRVGPAEVTERGSDLEVLIPIEEGRQRRVVTVSVEGASGLDLPRVMAELPLRAGGPFHPLLLAQSRDAIRARYEEMGYESAQASSDVTWSADGTLADVALRVLPGPQSVVDRVIVRGPRVTRPSMLRRVIDLEAGEILNTGRLLEVQRRLFALGIFSQVEVGRAPGTPFSGRRDVLVEVEEGRRRKVTYGLGYDSEEGIRALAGYSHSNLFGRALSARIDLRASDREELVRALVQQPFLGRHRVPTTLSLFRISEAKDSFRSKRRGTQAELRRFTDGTRLGLLYTYRIVEVEDVDPVLSELEIDRELREVQISSLTPSILVDKRDNPLDATSGWSALLQAEQAFPFLAANAEFTKLFGQYTHAAPLGPFGAVIGSLRLGAIEPHSGSGVDDPTVPGDLPSRFVPISERFFAGGRTTHRAYARDRLGIPGQTLVVVEDSAGERFVPVGGNGLLLANLDYRFPIAGPVGGSFFVDAGNVWADWRNLDFSQVKWGAGVGLRYLSPIGPLRLEVGWKLDREASEDPYVVLLSFGNPF